MGNCRTKAHAQFAVRTYRQQDLIKSHSIKHVTVRTAKPRRVRTRPLISTKVRQPKARNTTPPYPIHALELGEMALTNGSKRGRSRADTEETADDSGHAEASSHLRQVNSAVRFDGA